MEKTNEFHTGESSFLTYDPIVLVQDVCKKWLLILVIAVLAGVAAYIVTDMSYEPVYSSNATLVVTARGSSATVYSNLSSATTLAGIYSELLNSSLFRKTIMQTSGIQDFQGSIVAAQITDTNLLTLKVTASDARTAFLVIRAILENHEALTHEVVGNVALEVLQKPTIPTGPSNWNAAEYRMKQIALLAAAASTLVIVLMSYSSDKIRSAKEARKKIDCRYLGEIPHEKKYKTLRSWLRHKKNGILITNPVTSFRYLETIRKLRRRIEQRMDGGNVLMVTSVLENEGKSTVSVNLGMAMAKKHARILLIDCDMRKPACYTLMGQSASGAGLVSVLSGHAEPQDAVIQDRQSGMYMLLEKKGTRNSGLLIASQQMQALIAWARENFDYVILDLPPMSAVADAERMTELADAVVLVVRQNTSTAKQINRAVEALTGGKAQLLGCLLNNVHSTMLSSGQGYGYGYGGYHRYGGYYRYGGHYGHYGSRK